MKAKKGYTLIELLLVAIIVGLLAVLSLLGLNPIEQVKKSRDAGKLSKAKEAIPAAERYHSFQGIDPLPDAQGNRCQALIDIQELKGGACAGIVLSGNNGVYQATFIPESKAYQIKCGGDGVCTVPDEIL